LYWLVVSLALYLLGLRNVPATEAGSRTLERLLWLLPLVFVPAVFLCYLFPGARWWLLLRINVATMIGLLAAVWVVCASIDYGDSRNSGVASGFVVSLSLGSMLLATLDLVAIGVFWWSGRSLGALGD
jgi:hypothetical protein